MGCGRSKIVEKGPQPNNNVKEPQGDNKPDKKVNYVIQNKAILNKDPVGNHYQVLGKIGSGAFGRVYKAKNLKSGNIRAIKVVKKAMLKFQEGDKSFLKEIEMLVSLSHANIIKVFEYFEDEENYYVVEELADGGELYDQLSKMSSFSEKEAALIMKQILSAVVYLHSCNIVHRDLKPENILLESSEENSLGNLKLIDFGTANFCEKDNLTARIGTPYYIAPEVIKKAYDKQCDVWSCGIILYILLCGYPPYDGDDDDQIMKNIETKSFEFPDEEWRSVSSEAKSLITRMLIKDPKKRIMPQQALEDVWFKINTSKEGLNLVNLKDRISNIEKFSKKEKLQQACISFLVHQMSDNDQVKELKKLFIALDTSGDGRLTFKEIEEGLKTHPELCDTLGKDDLLETLKKIDTDENGYVDYEEFITATINTNNLCSNKNLKIAFGFFDKNNSGSLDHKEVKQCLVMLFKKDICSAEIQKVISDIDVNNDGQISFEEFEALMKRVIT